MIRGNPRKSVAKNSSDVQVLHVERVLLDELAPRFDVFAHERDEDGLAFGDIFQLHRKQRAALGIHRRLPKLRSCHLAQTFVTLDSELLPPFVDDVITKLADVGLFYDLDVFALGSLGSGLLLRFVFHRRRLAVHSVSIFFGGSFFSPSKSARLARSSRGINSVTCSLRSRLSAFSKNPRYSSSTVINRARSLPSSLAAPSP